MFKGRRRRPITTRDDTWIIRRGRGEDHNYENRENDDHRDGNADAVTQCGHRGDLRNPRPTGVWGDVGRGMRHAEPRIAVAHDRPQELTTVQSTGMCKYILQFKTDRRGQKGNYLLFPLMRCEVGFIDG